MENKFLAFAVICLLTVFLTSCNQNMEKRSGQNTNAQEQKNDSKLDLSKLEVYNKPDRIAPMCPEINAKETDGKYSEELKNYTGLIKVCNEQNIVSTLYELKNGKHDGYFCTYDDNGFLITKSYYKNDKKNGEMIYVDESGRILLKAKYKSGNLIVCEGPLCNEL